MPLVARAPERFLESMEVVFVGSFNPAIFHPEWFLRHGLVATANKPEQADRPPGRVVVTDEVTQVELDEIVLTCDRNRLSFSVSNPSRFPQLRALAESPLRFLPHTPLKALGFNRLAHWKLQSEGYWHTIGHTLAPKELVWNRLLKAPGMGSIRIESDLYSEDPHPYTITVIAEPSKRHKPGLFLSVNMHFDLSRGPDNRSPVENALTILQEKTEEAEQWADKASQAIFEAIPYNEL
jgi:hypothetical protein